MSLYLFHAEVFMPASYARPIHEGELKYGKHALSEATVDRYGYIPLPQSFTAAQAQLIEAEVDASTNEVVKQVWRQKLDAERDIVLVINRGGFVRTVWVNLRKDKHHTLNRSKYVRA